MALFFKSKEQKQYEQMQKLQKKKQQEEQQIEQLQQEIDQKDQEQQKIEQRWKAYEQGIQEQRQARLTKQEKEQPKKQKPAEVHREPVEITADPPRPLQVIHYLKNKSKFNPRYWLNWYKEKFFPHKTVLIEMELNNGFHRTFVVVEKKHGFMYAGKSYIFDLECKYYNLDQRLWCYFYHEDMTLPIKRNYKAQGYDDKTDLYYPINIGVNINEIKKALENSDLTETEQSINPSTLDRFIKSEIAEGIMKGAAINDFLRAMRLIIIVHLIITIVFMIVMFAKLGIFQSIKIPGVTG